MDNPKVAGHLALGGVDDAGATARCGQVSRLAETAPPGSRLVAAERSAPITLPVRRMTPFPRGWSVTADKRRLAPVGAGRLGSDFTSPGGSFTIWFRGSFGRGVKVLVDGRSVGRALSVQTPEQMAQVANVSLAAGRHRLEIVRGGGDLKPGNGQDEVYDTVFVAPDVPVRLVSMPPSLARSLCGRHLDWIEVTTPTGQAGSGGAAPLPAGETPCPDLGAVAVDERVLIGPRPGTFYSVDALNPDVVRRGSSYYMFFSGNRARTDVGQWRTGLAVAKSPEGPFVVDPRAAAPQLNGGTIVRDRAFVQGYDRRGKRVPLFGRSRAGRTWQRFEALPAGGPGEWNYFPSDIGLQPLAGGFRAYFAGRPGRSGADLGAVDYRDGRWASSPRQVLTRVEGTWDGRDLGQPSVFEANGREYMLYGGLAADGQPRQIGVAVRDKGQWRRCGDRPFIAAGPAWYSQNAIDPEPEVVGDRLYVYFGGGAEPSLGGNMSGTIGLRVYRLPDLFPRGM